jgi:very-short-patch-repair endonuclease
MPDQSTTDPLDARLAKLAERQHGVVSRGQLLELGLGKSAIGDWAKRGRLHGVHRGVYAVRYPTLTRNGRFMAAVLACGDGAALSHFSAAVLWGMLNGGGGAIHVTSEARRRRPGLVLHQAALGSGEVRKRTGIPVTAPARTLIDLADVAPRRTLERAIDEAEYLRPDCTGLARRHGRRGSGTLSSVLAGHTPGSTRTRTELEEMFISLCDNHGLPRPEVNVHIEGYECDFVWREQWLIVETDGAAAHSGERRRVRDLERDAELAAAGWRVIRITYERLLREPERVADQVGRALTPSRRPAAHGGRRRP